LFDNLINAHDFRRLARQAGRGRFRKVYTTLASRGRERVAQAWAATARPPTNWWDLPAVRARWNTLISGEPGVDHCEYLVRRHLAGRADLDGLSLGCGTGDRELRWARSGIFRRIDAVDVSAPRIAHARRLADQQGVGKLLRFRVCEVLALEERSAVYDVVLAEGSLHHLTPLEEVMRRVDRLLRPEGYFLVNDFVGPTRMQWTERQLEVINGLLAVLPERFRRRYDGRSIKRELIRPSRLSMILSDPSEAVESARILPLLGQAFEVVEVREFGGTVLHMLLSEIAHNFLTDDDETRRALRLCFEAEDLLLQSAELSSDFAVAVCRKRSS
jgi:ubiquinone/menaquinone biosynthesis C-methylase UbiE